MPGRALAGSEPPRGLGFRGWGPRVGFTVNPDQVHGGLQVDLGAVAHRVRLVPDLEFGIGDHAKLTALDIEVFYRFVEEWSAWAPYIGAGPGFFLLNVDPEIGEGDTRTDIGLNLVLGVERGLSNNKFFVEARVGLADAPDLKGVLGWTFIKGGAGDDAGNAGAGGEGAR